MCQTKTCHSNMKSGGNEYSHVFKLWGHRAENILNGKANFTPSSHEITCNENNSCLKCVREAHIPCRCCVIIYVRTTAHRSTGLSPYNAPTAHTPMFQQRSCPLSKPNNKSGRYPSIPSVADLSPLSVGNLG